MYDYILYSSPVGTLTAAARGDALVGLVLEGQRHADEHLRGGGRERETAILHQTKAWLDAYFSGREPGSLPKLDPQGTPFQRRVWAELLAIPYGETRTYGQLAARLGSSPRAVGSAVGRNPISLIIPCHRVLGRDGSLTGYAGGVDKKAWLLRWEGAPFRR